MATSGSLMAAAMVVGTPGDAVIAGSKTRLSGDLFVQAAAGPRAPVRETARR